ncbi:MAG: PDZ domain-containing protein [Anaerolineae bacterium]|jgi:serine protease Do|nr:PDZ domain-containing protein [Anaerolineae bacterium]
MVAESQAAGGGMTAPLIGLNVEPLTDEHRARLHSPALHGVVVIGVVEGAAAHAAGLRPYDVITDFGGAPVTSPDELFALVASHQAGETVVVTGWRGQAAREWSVTLQARRW